MALIQECEGDPKLVSMMDKQSEKEDAVSDNNDDGTIKESRKRRSPSPPCVEEQPQPEMTLSNSQEKAPAASALEEKAPVEEEAAPRPPPPPVKQSPPTFVVGSARPTVIRKSPPSRTPAAVAAQSIFPATPASNSAVAVRRTSGSAKKAAVLATPTPVFSTSMPTPRSTPSTGGKTQRGLRHFSVMVCKHVEARGTTTYNQVADELVRQVIAERNAEGGPKGKFDEKNIRRRVYDALNVLLAMDIISKDKKDIIWRGLPRPTAPPAEETNEEDDEETEEDGDTPAEDREEANKGPIYTDESEYDEHEFAAMKREREFLQAEVNRKQEALREILIQQVCFRNLVMRNQKREYPRHGGPHKPPPADEKIPLPFIISNTKPSAVVQCDMNKEKTDVMFEFDNPFEINDDNTILKRMEMDKTTVHALQGMLPEDMFDYCRDTGILESVLLPGEDPNTTARAPHFRAYRSHHRS